ncbi:MAG: mRNA interferase MazF [Sphingomonadales bacterium]|nr:mRNA interferase MazF [Sphingomonadales bacterium]
MNRAATPYAPRRRRKGKEGQCGATCPFRVPLRFDGKEGLLLPDQMRSLDRRRLVKRLGAVEAETLAATLAVLRELFAE